MICFEVQINGEKICKAGFDAEFGVLSSGLTWANNRHQPSGEVAMRLSLHVGGLTSPENDSGEFLTWLKQEIRVGDEVSVRVVEAIDADEPFERELNDPELHCSFCGKSESKVSGIIDAERVCICTECVEVCNQVIAGNEEVKFGDGAV